MGLTAELCFWTKSASYPWVFRPSCCAFSIREKCSGWAAPDVFRVDVRVVAATNSNLAERARDQQFREDLFYRLSVFPIELPGLAQRRGDVAALARHFLCKFQSAGPEQSLSPESLCVLENHSWPGNVRELQHVIERACILAEGGPILPEHLGLPTPEAPATASPACHFA